MKLKFVFTILLIILFALLPIRSRTNYLFTYEEAQTENTNPSIIHDIGIHDDNTIVVHIVFKNSSSISPEGEICLDQGWLPKLFCLDAIPAKIFLLRQLTQLKYFQQKFFIYFVYTWMAAEIILP